MINEKKHKKSRKKWWWWIREQGTGVYQYDLSVELPDGTPYRERRNVPEFTDEGQRIVTTAEREAFVVERFSFLHEHGKEDPDEIARRIEAKALTTEAYLESWLTRREARQVASVRDDRVRLRTHAIPAIGKIPLVDLRPHHVRDLLRELPQKPSRKGGKLAPRTQRHVYFLLRQALHDAVVEETIPSNPAMVDTSEIPQKRDKDTSGWRDRAVFTHDEVEQLISDERIPEDRRVGYALEFLTGMRTGEVSALCWRHYETAQPLGKLVVEVAYNTRTHEVKATKTERPRKVPVHPTLAKVLATWKLSGWKRLFDRDPKRDDLIVPARGGGPKKRDEHRNVAWALSLFHTDLETLGLRKRRHYDSRRTFVSLAQDDGANGDLVRWLTHPPGDTFALYTTPSWEALCEAVSKLRIKVRDDGGGEVVPLRVAASVE
jgi:integrase